MWGEGGARPLLSSPLRSPFSLFFLLALLFSAPSIRARTGRPDRSLFLFLITAFSFFGKEVCLDLFLMVPLRVLFNLKGFSCLASFHTLHYIVSIGNS